MSTQKKGQVTFYLSTQRVVTRSRVIPFIFYPFALGLLLSLAVCLNSLAQNVRWRVYNTSNSEIPDNYILSIAIDQKGNKWLGTNWGLVRFDGSNFYKYHKKKLNEFQYTTVRSITIDSSQKILTGSWGDGMAELRFPDGNPNNPNALYKWIYYRQNNSAITNNTVKVIKEEPDGSLWIGTEDGLVLMEKIDDFGAGGIKWKTFFSNNSGLPNDKVYAIAIDRFNNKWIGTFGGGLAKFDGTNWTVYDIKNSGLPDNYIISLAADNNNMLWIGTYSGGLARFDGTTWKVFKTSNSKIPDNIVYSMAVDKNNNLWVGTINSGLAKFDGKVWTTFDIMDSGLPYTVSSIAIDKNGNKWIGTGGGLAVFNENGIKP